MSEPTEAQTRREKIDPLLKEQGWDVKNSSQVKLEVDTKQSNFVSLDYKTVKETLKNDEDSKYVDYLLLDSTGAPLAIVEAKRTSKDSFLGQRQAEEYADDIKRQTGKDVFIFLTNGEQIRFWDRSRYPPRLVKGFYSRRDLERLRFQASFGQVGQRIEINPDIVDRAKGIECSKRVIEHIHRGNRKALIVMATGTGKTRVAMGIIDLLMRENLVQKVLFLTDRKALRDQAFDKGYKVYFPEESKEQILSGIYNQSKRLYVSTIQTFQEIFLEKSNGVYNLSPGEFDLIISDEAHRSIYHKWRDIFTYFDAIQIGLTATPADLIERDTFRFFGCQEHAPTALYSYEEAVEDGVLVDFRKGIVSAQTHFKIHGITPRDLTEGERQRLIEQGIDPDEINFEGSELEKKVAVKGTSEAIVREFMDSCLRDQSGMLPAKTIFFAISKKHAARLQEAFDTLYPEYRGDLARTIVSEDSRASTLIKMFENDSFPRVAISVDMLDTGIDVPEVCNLVFTKPVFSKIKFWQMLGRGTRSNAACKHFDWLPNGKKELFLVFDFWNNFEYWDMHPEGKVPAQVEALMGRVFLTRLKQLEYAMNREDGSLAASVREKIMGDVKALPMDSVTVREHKRDIEKALSPDLWDNVGLDPLSFLKERIMPLMRFRPGGNPDTASFTLKCEQLGLAALQQNGQEIERLKGSIGTMVDCLPETINAVREMADVKREVLSHSFWNSLSYDDSQKIMTDLGPLMLYMQKEPSRTIIIDMTDPIEQRKIISLREEQEQAHITQYREQVEARIRTLADRNPAIVKIRENKTLTHDDLVTLEETLLGPEFGEQVEGEEYGTGGTSARDSVLVRFIRQVLGLYEQPDPETLIRDAFQTFMIDQNRQYSADQLTFIRMIQSVFAKNHHIEFRDFYEPPFTNLGASVPMPMFSEDDLKAFVGICGRVERQLVRVEA
jgi:type I restriction enzyme R subunit